MRMKIKTIYKNEFRPIDDTPFINVVDVVENKFETETEYIFNISGIPEGDSIYFFIDEVDD